MRRRTSSHQQPQATTHGPEARKPVHVRRARRRVVYDPKRAEYVVVEPGPGEIEGEVIPAGLEAETRSLERTTHVELPPEAYRVRKEQRRTALKDLTTLGFAVGLSEDVRGGMATGLAKDRDLVAEIDALLREIGSTDGINRIAVGHALALLAIQRRRHQFVTVRDLMDAIYSGDGGYEDLRLGAQFDTEFDPEDASRLAAIRKEEDETLSAIRILRSRLREARVTAR